MLFGRAMYPFYSYRSIKYELLAMQNPTNSSSFVPKENPQILTFISINSVTVLATNHGVYFPSCSYSDIYSSSCSNFLAKSIFSSIFCGVVVAIVFIFRWYSSQFPIPLRRTFRLPKNVSPVYIYIHIFPSLWYSVIFTFNYQFVTEVMHTSISHE